MLVLRPKWLLSAGSREELPMTKPLIQDAIIGHCLRDARFAAVCGNILKPQDFDSTINGLFFAIIQRSVFDCGQVPDSIDILTRLQTKYWGEDFQKLRQAIDHCQAISRRTDSETIFAKLKKTPDDSNWLVKALEAFDSEEI